ncbi:MAG: DivIVA domain-containing protein [Candidatus Cloacimonetes bacterium]|nr:DivIVA domain-containing protein [Candidatus Cloacimonadota bacterium]
MFDKIEISPADIRHKEFKTSAIGYNKAEIRDYLDILAEHFEDLYSQRLMNNKETPQVNVYEDRTQTQIAMEQIQKREELISKTLIQAENTRNEIIRTAQKEADNILRDAELSAKKAIDETKHYLNLMKHEFVNLKENHRQFLINSHSQLKGQLTRYEQDHLFTKETEAEMDKKFDEISRIKVEPHSRIRETNRPVESQNIKIEDTKSVSIGSSNRYEEPVKPKAEPVKYEEPIIPAPKNIPIRQEIKVEEPSKRYEEPNIPPAEPVRKYEEPISPPQKNIAHQPETRYEEPSRKYVETSIPTTIPVKNIAEQKNIQHDLRVEEPSRVYEEPSLPNIENISNHQENRYEEPSRVYEEPNIAFEEPVRIYENNQSSDNIHSGGFKASEPYTRYEEPIIPPPEPEYSPPSIPPPIKTARTAVNDIEIDEPSFRFEEPTRQSAESYSMPPLTPPPDNIIGASGANKAPKEPVRKTETPLTFEESEPSFKFEDPHRFQEDLDFRFDDSNLMNLDANSHFDDFDKINSETLNLFKETNKKKKEPDDDPPAIQFHS